MHQSGVSYNIFLCSPVKRKNPEDGKEESCKSGGESSSHSGEKNLGTSKVCDLICMCLGVFWWLESS